ncbi:MAG: rod shape-determining protein MreD [Alphaproteobacteria bacterium]|nr:rod shape-determining protein MreD [Alphaproteobacteria bacterium]
MLTREYTLKENVVKSVQKKIPILVSFIFVIISVIPSRIDGFDEIKPVLSIITVFFWTIYRPDIFGIFSAFLVGLFEDVIGAGSLGINALVFMVMHQIIDSRRRFFIGSSFPVLWSKFAAVTAVAFVMKYILFAATTGMLAPMPMFIFSYITTGACYLLVGMICVYARIFLEEI